MNPSILELVNFDKVKKLRLHLDNNRSVMLRATENHPITLQYTVDEDEVKHYFVTIEDGDSHDNKNYPTIPVEVIKWYEIVFDENASSEE